ncbi:MAG: hypothetical protein OXG68_20190 [Chloroflexi bacterium]|nr:hypothetical protein [Chloroflexota bacterium]
MKALDRRGIVGKLVSRLFQSPLERDRSFYRRYRELSGLIDEAPDALVAYTLRGELNLERGEYERAQTDFGTAVELADALDEDQGWHLIEQVMRDRALYGLEVAREALRAAR